ncbi:unnamed protein product [Ostreobium quekettii]|uniref:Polyprenol reductase n=1 Tax=Ostreobium quekettii TaxID=121088 RepID=A0A8S1JEF2_9CHLO|nr:unnamed protein product [Ostreobium quekettii]|eukprot:evm.model.scf_321.6 EVM.evm.TU.scf_321.6   scf_321:79365-81461(+)
MLPLVLAAVPVLIELFWALAAASVVLALFPLPGLGLFRSAVLLSAARGKTWQSRPAVLGRFKDMSVPHDWFWHFYVAGSFSNTLFLYLISWHWSSGGHLHNAAQVLCCVSISSPISFASLTNQCPSPQAKMMQFMLFGFADVGKDSGKLHCLYPTSLLI